MPKRIPVQRVIVYRDGNQTIPPIGKAFDFTASELDDFARMNPNAVTKIGQVDLSDDDGSDEVKPETPVKLTKAQQAAKDKADAEAEATRLATEQTAGADKAPAGDDTL